MLAFGAMILGKDTRGLVIEETSVCNIVGDAIEKTTATFWG